WTPVLGNLVAGATEEGRLRVNPQQDPGFHTREHRDGDVILLVVSGEIDHASAPRFTGELRRCLDQRPRLLVIGRTAVTRVASAGVRALVAAGPQNAEPTTTRFVISSPTVLRVLEMVGLLGQLAVYPTRADALTGAAVRPVLRHRPGADMPHS